MLNFIGPAGEEGERGKTVQAAVLTQQRVLIDVGGNANYGGILTTSPSINGNVWNNMIDARPGIRVANALTVNNQPSGISLEVINRLDGTYSINSLGIGNGNSAGIVGDYPASATYDHALIHSSAANGKWKLTGLQAAKTYQVKFWGTRGNTTAARNAEIKRADDNVWKSYSATANTDYNNAAVFSIAGKTEMEFDIRTKAGSDFSALNVVDISYDDSSSNPPPVNQAPVARAGADTTIQLPVDSVSLRGCSSSDPEGAVLKFKWRKISGPASYQLPADTLCTVKAKGLVAGVYGFELTVTDTAGLTGKDSVLITVNSITNTNWPPQVTPLCNRPYKIVVIGSSTAYGTGANPIDSSWVNKFKRYLFVQNQQVQLINIASPGFTSWDVSPTGTPVPAPFTIDTFRNITKAISYQPDAIIINLPSNDAARGIPVADIHNNMLRITSLAASANIPVWVSTTQPRDGLSPAATTLQMELRDWINTTYGNKSVDFWTTIANADGTINSFYGAGDGVHLNNYGHHVLFTRIVAEKIWDSICLRNIIVTPNLAPIARAGTDTTIQLPIDSVSLRGCLSSDPEGAVLRYKWRKISGPATYQLPADSFCTVKAKALLPGTYSFELTVTDPAGLTGKDSVTVNVNAVITTNWPPQVTPLCNRPYKIVVVGSSTAFGTGANPIDSSWVRKFRSYLLVQNQQVQVINIATLGLTSWDVSPTGTPVPAPYVIDTLRNITKALSYNPDAIILSLPSNDVARGIAANDTRNNYLRITGLADAANIPVWVTTTQPRDGLSAAERILQMNLRDWINTTYGNKSVDYWSTIANTDGTINSFYGAGDGVHLNNYGHHVLFTRIVEEKLWDTICNRHPVSPSPNIAPVANAGPDISIAQMRDSIQLDGSASFDADGQIIKYRWRKISGPAAVLPNDSISRPWVKPAAPGTYLFELAVTDDSLAVGKDTVRLSINAAPVARAGADQQMVLPANTALLNGSASTDPDGTIVQYRWKKISGAGTVNIADTTTAETPVSFVTAGQYLFELTVTDNAGATGKDSVLITVNPSLNAAPVARAGADQQIVLPANTGLLNGSVSTDPDGTIIQYRWKKISGVGTVNITDTTAAQTLVSFVTSGQYLFELTVTDNAGAAGKDSVLITVIPSLNAAPVARAGADQQIVLPANIALLNGSASTDPDGTIIQYRWKKISGVGTVNIADSTAAQTPVSFVTAGQYLFELTVTDNLFATAKDTVQITVNATVNNPPVANAGADKTIQLPVNRVLVDGRSSFDPEASALGFNWQYLSGPAGSQVLTPSRDTSSIVFANAGTYVFKLTVTDAGGLSAADSITISVLPVADFAKRIKVNIYGGANPYTNAQWNNWQMVAGVTSPYFSYDDGLLSTVNASINESALIVDNGAAYAAAATVCPQQVLRYNSANTSRRTLTLSGFDPSRQYSFEFYASRSNTGNSTVYTIGSKFDTISTSSNINDFVRLTNISPDNTGKILVNITTIGTWNYIAGFMITEQPPAGATVSARGPWPVAGGDEIVKDALSGSEVLMIYPNPVKSIMSVQIPTAVKAEYRMDIVNVFGNLVFTRSGFKRNKTYTESINLADLRKGIYFLKLFASGRVMSTKIIKL